MAVSVGTRQPLHKPLKMAVSSQPHFAHMPPPRIKRLLMHVDNVSPELQATLRAMGVRTFRRRRDGTTISFPCDRDTPELVAQVMQALREEGQRSQQ